MRRTRLIPSLAIPLALVLGCTPKRPGVAVTARLAEPVESRWVEAAVRMVPDVQDVRVAPPSPSYTLTGKRIPERASVSFTAPSLSGAIGGVHQSIDQRDFTTTELVAWAEWRDKPTEEQKRTARRTLERLVGWILLTARSDGPDASK